MMHRQRFLLTAGAAALGLSGRGFPANASELDGKYGGENFDPGEFKGVQQFLPPSMLARTFLAVNDPFPANATRVVLENLPPVMRQGAPGSCEADSFGYCLGGYTATRDVHGAKVNWSASDPNNTPSAAWLYQWAHGIAHRSCPAGSRSVVYPQHLLAEGAPSTAQAPYNPQNLTGVALCQYIEGLNMTARYSGSERFVIGSYKAVNLTTATADFLPTFKELLRNRHAIAFSGLVPKGYGAPKPPLMKNAYTAPRGFIKGSGHGQVIVGFDDSQGPIGAFLVQNSFGPGWNPGDPDDPGHNGRIWYGYNAFFRGQSYALIMFPSAQGDVSGTSLRASVANAPSLKVVNAVRNQVSGKSTLAFVFSASAPLNMKSIVAQNQKTGTRYSVNLNEMMRLGYHYVWRNGNAYPAGAYEMTVRALSNGTQVTYSGAITVV
jgi:hypothetical protein